MSQSRYPNWEALRDSDPNVIDDYTLEARLGSGGFGVVYAATAPDGSPVALKVLRSELSDDQGLRRRLAREAEALRRVEGNRTVKVLDVVIDADQTYLVMERLEGRTLEDLVKSQGPLQPATLWLVAEGLIEALSDIYDAGIVHRDLKPS
ncbi:MAG: protein kinase, partial [Actinomycetota bacterium]|nr:protein kinase [Actinomycetota bacterium]